MSFVLSSIPAANHDFAQQVCQSIWEGSVGRVTSGAVEPEYIYANGSLSPNSEKYVAERFPCSWMVHFDFGKGVVHRIRIQLPDECAGAMA